MATTRGTVFISYAHENDDHVKRVWELAEWLDKRRWTVIYDRPFIDTPPGEGWSAWMRSGIKTADCVLIVCSPKLKERYEKESPHRFVDRIRTPMLVIHGELDHRVPISEALRLWTDLQRHGVPSRFLYFPDENHWVLKPQNARLWYGTVLAFLDETVLGTAWVRPDLV